MLLIKVKIEDIIFIYLKIYNMYLKFRIGMILYEIKKI